jgi:hypothetical protein
MTAPQTPNVNSGWLAAFVWGICVFAGGRIGWDVVGFLLDMLAGTVGK